MTARLPVALTLLAAAVAQADGAFPDSQALFAPADQPNRLLLATNFGLIETVDDGVTWHITCEIYEQAPNAYLYVMGTARDHRLLALSLNGLSFSDDSACSWTVTHGGIPAVTIRDAFVDPSDGGHVLAIAYLPGQDGGVAPPAIYESINGGASFSATPLYTAPQSSYLTGLEISASSPSTYYATMYTTQPTFTPYLVRSDNAGATWIQNDLSGPLGDTTLRLAAVDPFDSTVVYLRLVSAMGVESLGIATDGGALAVSALTLSTGNKMTGFLRRADGSLLVSQGPAPGTFLSTNQGGTWQTVLPNYHLRAMAERDGGLFIAGDNYNDHFAVAEALDYDGGESTLLTYQVIQGPASCADGGCDIWWQGTRQIIDPQFDAGGSHGDGGADAGTPKKSGCQCGEAPQVFPWLAGLLVLAALGRRRLKRTL